MEWKGCSRATKRGEEKSGRDARAPNPDFELDFGGIVPEMAGIYT